MDEAHERDVLHGIVSAQQLSALSGLPLHELTELVEYGSLVPIIPDASVWTFSSRCVTTLQRAVRLRHDLVLDFDAFALAVGLIGEISALECESSRRRPPATVSEFPS